MCVFAEFSPGSQIPQLADESLVPTDTCTESEIVQFAERFQEWALVNKELEESSDPALVDLNSAVTQSRLQGLTPFEKQQVLKVRRGVCIFAVIWIKTLTLSEIHNEYGYPYGKAHVRFHEIRETFPIPFNECISYKALFVITLFISLVFTRIHNYLPLVTS